MQSYKLGMIEQRSYIAFISSEDTSQTVRHCSELFPNFVVMKRWCAVEWWRKMFYSAGWKENQDALLVAHFCQRREFLNKSEINISPHLNNTWWCINHISIFSFSFLILYLWYKIYKNLSFFIKVAKTKNRFCQKIRCFHDRFSGPIIDLLWTIDKSRQLIGIHSVPEIVPLDSRVKRITLE